MRVGSLVVALVALTVPCAALAQTSPPANPPPASAPAMMHPRVMDSAFALGAAYREIGRAENAGAAGHYIDAARAHYRSAIGRHGRSDDAGAAAEARLASDLARVALDERPPNAQTGPKDVPAPPTPRPVPGMAHEGTMMIEGMPRMMPPGGPGGFDGPPGMRVMIGSRAGMRHGGFDATELAEILKVETSPEARQLAQNAVDANAAAQRAALAGNVQEAARQTRIGDDIVAAVHDLAALNHPELAHPTIRMRTVGDGPMFRAGLL